LTSEVKEDKTYSGMNLAVKGGRDRDFERGKWKKDLLA